MDPEPIVLDISSDEESSGCREEPKGCDFDWLAEFLRTGEDDKPSDEDSDEVVVLREVKPTGKSKSSKPTMTGGDDDDDDDCLILDGDPDNSVVDEDANSTSGSDELLIVGEKGQIACRDFPHSRHLCYRFPFSATPHEKHCDLCHCYVCDLPAPCMFWATCNYSTGHCHATDKEEVWKAQRRNFKSGKIAPLASPKLSETLRPVDLPQRNPVSPLNILRLSPNSRTHNLVTRPTTIQACSSTNFSVPTILSQSRGPQSGVGLPKNRFRPRAGGQFPVASHNIRRGKGGQPIGNSGHCLVPSPHTTFKRPGNVGVLLPVGQTTCYSSNSRNCAVAGQYARTAPVPVLNNLNTIRWENDNSSTHQSFPRPNLGSTALSTPSSQQLYNQPIPPSTERQNFHQHGDQFQNIGQTVYQFGNEPQNPGQTLCPAGIQGASTKAANSIDYDPSLVISACQSNQQQQPPVEHFQVQGTEPSNEPLIESSSQLNIRTTNLSSSYGLNDWLLDGPSVPVVSDGSSMPPVCNNIFSPEPTSIDPGSLFCDFETSWNGLHA